MSFNHFKKSSDKIINGFHILFLLPNLINIVSIKDKNYLSILNTIKYSLLFNPYFKRHPNA